MKKNVRGNAGETLVETLVAILVSTLSLVLLATVISGTKEIVETSRDRMLEYYGNNNAVAAQSDTGDEATATISYGTTELESVAILRYEGDTLQEKTIVSYKVK